MNKKFLGHLKLYSKSFKQRTPTTPPSDISERMKYVSYDDSWPDYEDPAVDVKVL